MWIPLIQIKEKSAEYLIRHLGCNKIGLHLSFIVQFWQKEPNGGQFTFCFIAFKGPFIRIRLGEMNRSTPQVDLFVKVLEWQIIDVDPFCGKHVLCNVLLMDI